MNTDFSKLYKEKIDSRASELQEECHKAVEVVMSKMKNISYQDAVNTWIFCKLAEIELNKSNWIF